jgi:hypothetical protein
MSTSTVFFLLLCCFDLGNGVINVFMVARMVLAHRLPSWIIV